MVTAINGTWELPVGYFLIKGLTSVKKESLLQCLNYLIESGVQVTSITFEECTTNVAVGKLLGCSLDPNRISTKVQLLDTEVYIFPDPSHILKFIRNTFGELIQFVDEDGCIIAFKYAKRLHELQENEGPHLANKLFYYRNIPSCQMFKVSIYNFVM